MFKCGDPTHCPYVAQQFMIYSLPMRRWIALLWQALQVCGQGCDAQLTTAYDILPMRRWVALNCDKHCKFKSICFIYIYIPVAIHMYYRDKKEVV